MGGMASQISGLTIVYSIVHSCADQRKHQSSASLAFVRGIHRWPVNSPHKWPVMRKMFPSDDVMKTGSGNDLLPDGTEPSYLNQYWLFIKVVQWQSHESNLTRRTYEINPRQVFGFYIFKDTTIFPRNQRDNSNIRVPVCRPCIVACATYPLPCPHK